MHAQFHFISGMYMAAKTRTNVIFIKFETFGTRSLLCYISIDQSQPSFACSGKKITMYTDYILNFIWICARFAYEGIEINIVNIPQFRPNFQKWGILCPFRSPIRPNMACKSRLTVTVHAGQFCCVLDRL